MQNLPPARSVSLLTLSALLFQASCIKEISSEERLERETKLSAQGQALSAEELSKISCQDTPQQLAKARHENRPEAERIQAYMELDGELQKRSRAFEDAMARNPDLAYQEGSQQLVAARDDCVQHAADVRVEFDRFVRELVEVPTVQEIKGGSAITVARMEFDLIRQAIEALGPEDKDQLLSRIALVEKKLDRRPEPTKKRGR